jgi:hypothetical protein
MGAYCCVKNLFLLIICFVKNILKVMNYLFIYWWSVSTNGPVRDICFIAKKIEESL